jgi:putative acetyltransferase
MCSDTVLRVASDLDRDDIRALHLSAFSEDENQLVASLADNLLDEETNPGTISLVAETGSVLVGHVAFSPVAAEAGGNWQGYILAPLGVKPAHRNRGLGTKLVKSGIEQLKQNGVNVLFVYGDPDYYRRFGFGAKAAATFSPPYRLKYPSGWQAIVLNEGRVFEKPVGLSCVASLRDQALW